MEPSQPRPCHHVDSSHLTAPSDPHACPDCPAVRSQTLGLLRPGPERGCAFTSVPVEARDPLPVRWFREYSVAIVRRGIVIRQRMDARGRATAVDVVGTGAGFLVPRSAGGASASSAPTGYAATRALVCLCREADVIHSLGDEQTALEISRLQQDAVARMERLADARGRPTLQARFAALLCTLADTLAPLSADPQRIAAGLLQRDLAALIAARHESVCRVMRALTEQGAIEPTAEGLYIRDRQMLEAL